jgi:hypothetical protein
MERSITMTKDDENKLTMLESTSTLLKLNRSKLNLPALLSAADRLDSVLAKLKVKIQDTMTASKGKTETKAEAADILVSELFKVSKGLFAYGAVTDNVELKERVRVTASQLRYMRDTELVAKARTISEQGTKNEPKVADYGVTEEILTRLNGMIDAFETAIGERESSVAQRKGARSSVYENFDAATQILENEIDNLMERFNDTDPQFFNEYWEARVVKDVGLRHRPPPPPPPPAPGQTPDEPSKPT